MPVDLVGVAHRTVHISNLPGRDLVADMLRLLSRKCGEVEQWDWDEGETSVVVVFKSMDSIPRVVAFNNMVYLGKPLIVWKHRDTKPEAVLAIEMKAGVGTTQTSTVSTEEAEEEAKRVEQMRGVLAKLNAEIRAAMGGSDAPDTAATPAVRGLAAPLPREVKLGRLRVAAREQLAAVIVLNRAFLEKKAQEIAQLNTQLSALTRRQ